jgi:purine-binding chemotaxis protein CheW
MKFAIAKMEQMLPAYLLVTAEAWHCALPLTQVIEVLRPFEVGANAGTMRGERGSVTVRGQSVPVVDLGTVLGGAETEMRARLVHVRMKGAREAVLAVDRVLGVQRFEPEHLRRMPVAGVSREASVLERDIASLLEMGGLVSDEDWIEDEQSSEVA